MASGSTQPPLVSQVRSVMITVAVVGFLLLTCGLFNLGAAIWGFGRVGQVPAGQAGPAEKNPGLPAAADKGAALPLFSVEEKALPAAVKKGARISFGALLTGELRGTVHEVRGSWVFIKDLEQKDLMGKDIPKEKTLNNTWLNLNNMLYVKAIE